VNLALDMAVRAATEGAQPDGVTSASSWPYTCTSPGRRWWARSSPSSRRSLEVHLPSLARAGRPPHSPIHLWPRSRSTACSCAWRNSLSPILPSPMSPPAPLDEGHGDLVRADYARRFWTVATCHGRQEANGRLQRARVVLTMDAE
jgi:hypothetical protein